MSPANEGRPSPQSSWLGSVWSLRQPERIVIGEVRAVDGELVTLAVVGVANDAPPNAQTLPSTEGSDQLVHVSTASLVTRWQRVSGARPEGWQRYRPMR